MHATRPCWARVETTGGSTSPTTSCSVCWTCSMRQPVRRAQVERTVFSPRCSAAQPTRFQTERSASFRRVRQAVPNAGSGFEGDARINAWDFVLMLEGAALFAASTARRLESNDAAILAAPFTVRSRSGVAGAASAGDDADARGEIWMPLWSAPSTLEELRCLVAEGRAALNGRPARDGLDFARAVAQLGVDRGIAGFQRYGFLMRSGKAFLATPLNRVAVRRNPDADLITELERRNWLGSVQRYARDDNAPNAFRSAARQLDTALFALTQQASREALQAVLRRVGRIEAALGISAKWARSSACARVPPKQAWAGKADDGSAEFRIACALAGLTLPGADGYRALHTRRHLAAVSEASNKEGDRKWDPTRALPHGRQGRSRTISASLLHRRRLEAAQAWRARRAAVQPDRRHASRCGRVSERRHRRRPHRRLAGGLSCVD